MKEEIVTRLSALRAVMKSRGVNAAIIPQSDPHQSEYLADHWQVRRFLSGFTGSAGTLVVTADEALLWTDSRYFIQAAQQLEGTSIQLMKMALPDTPTIPEYLCSKLQDVKDATIGIDGMLFSMLEYEQMLPIYTAKDIKVVTDFDVIDNIWRDRPSLPSDKVFVHEEKYAGESATSKMLAAMTAVKENGAEALFLSALDEIAWILNIRCSDVEYNPVATAYLYVTDCGATLLIDPVKISPEVEQYLSSQRVSIFPYSEVKKFLAELPENLRLYIDPASTSAEIGRIVGARAVMGPSVVAVPKACRNEVQIAGIRAAMERDGAALVKAFMEIERRLAAGERTTEITVAQLLRKYRSEQPLFFDESFGTIAGYGAHGAIVHYEATEETDVELHPTGLLLVDSGAQYRDGTTDITRTVALGTPTAEERHNFTLVLRGCIDLAMMVFPVGTRGAQIDVEARKYLWREGFGYRHGTGHGVGQFLNVHEGPQSIRMEDNPMPLCEGMVTSDEPGLYIEGLHGIRCENLVLCVKAMTGDYGEFLKFENLTLFPFDITLIEVESLTADQRQWLNDYHAEVFSRLSPYLNDAEKTWLQAKTRAV